MTLEELLSRFERKERAGAGWKVMCPAHEDKNPSLSVSESETDGKLLVHCHAQCTTKSVCAALGIKVDDLFLNGHGKSKPEPIVAEYNYTDEIGNVLFQVVRKANKEFPQRRPNGTGGWIWNTDGVRRVLYRLPEVVAARDVFVVEGEKDSDTLHSLDLVATCNPGGAGKWNKKEYSEKLRGKNVTILADNDEPGQKHARQVATSLHLVAASVKLIDTLPMPEGKSVKDVSDWVAQGFTRAALLALVADTKEWNPDEAAEAGRKVQLSSLSTAELFASQEQKIVWLAWPFAAVGLSSILDGLPKMGKSRFYLEGIHASRESRIFLGQATQPMRVIYVSEQSAASLAMQVREVGFSGSEPVEELRWFTREHWSRFTYEEFLAALETEYLNGAGYNCLVMDTWHTVARLEDENSASEVNRLGNLTLDLATRQKLALSLARHDRKSGGDVGLSGRSSIQLSGLVDVILHLVRLPGQAALTQRRLQLLGRVPGLPADQVIELCENGYRNYGSVEGGVETHMAVEKILARAPTSEEAALPLSKILEGTGLVWGQPVRDAVQRLEDKGLLRRKGKGKSTKYWTEELRLRA
jgi:putative DNA primase/helicase